MEMETDENVVSQHGDTDLDDLIQYEEVEYDYDDTEDEDNQMDQNTSMEEEHLDYEEEAEALPVAITKVVHVPQTAPGRQTIVRSE